MLLSGFKPLNLDLGIIFLLFFAFELSSFIPTCLSCMSALRQHLQPCPQFLSFFISSSFTVLTAILFPKSLNYRSLLESSQLVLNYTASALRAISLSTYGKPLFRNLWRNLCELSISRTKPTRRGYCSGQRKKILSHVVQEGLNPQANSFLYQQLDLEKKICDNLHFGNQSFEANVLIFRLTPTYNQHQELIMFRS